MLKSLICSLSGHVIHRKKVWHDGYDYRTTCRRCEADLLRGMKRWRKFETERDGNAQRKPHPHHAH